MKVHFISIGGSVMHQLAIALQGKCYQVTGTDDEIFEPALTHLRDKGLLPSAFGWQPALITPDLDAVILGMHAKADNPELMKAQELGLSIYSFPEYIFHESQQKKRVVVGGSHGKTTTTSMIMHVLKTCHQDFDYLVGAKLAGFEQSVKVTNAPTIVCEGDEYLASALLRQPKFHFLFPHVAILTGIAWDHINVFPTFENYVEQFEIFVNQITKGGNLVYNEEDETVKKVAEETTNIIRRLPYKTPSYSVEDGTTLLDTPEGPMPIEVFGAHNLNNLAGAKWICQNMGIDEADFYEAIASFKGASKRLEKIAEGNGKVAYKDFAHSPSKVSATTKAVKAQYPNRKLVACLELHTYSSLNAEFLKEYEGALDAADVAVVFYSPDAVKIKQLEEVSYDQIAQSFQRDDLIIYTNPAEFKDFLFNYDLNNSALLLMSSGNYGGLNFDEVKRLVN